MSVSITQNFDWSETSRRLVVFMPNFNGRCLTEESIRRIRTVCEKRDWLIMIGNDNVDNKWDHLRSQNVVYFTMYRDKKIPRNGAFIRNYVIKRCQSEYFCQKDGEVLIDGDFIGQIILCGKGCGWRVGYTASLSANRTEEFLRGSRLVIDTDVYRKIDPVTPLDDLGKAKQYLIEMDGRINFTTHFHYGFCVCTKILRGMHGYDEDYELFGWEDVDLYLRLASQKVFLVPDYTCRAAHLYHALTASKLLADKMKTVFQKKDPIVYLRNLDSWGEGE